MTEIQIEKLLEAACDICWWPSGSTAYDDIMNDNPDYHEPCENCRFEKVLNEVLADEP